MGPNYYKKKIEAINKVTSEDWRKCIEHTKKIEDQFRKNDIAKDHVYETFKINIEDVSNDDMELLDV